MKKISCFLLLIPFFLCCRENNQHTEKKLVTVYKKEIKDQNKDGNKNDSILICHNKKEYFNEYNKLSGNDEIKTLDKLGSKLYYAISKKNFNDLFNRININCIAPGKSKKHTFFTIKYNGKQNAKDVFLKIKKIKRDNENLNKYHDFFKRGLVFVLDSKKNEMTIITFNIFTDNSSPEKVKSFFTSNKTSFEKVFMTTGIGTTLNLVE